MDKVKHWWISNPITCRNKMHSFQLRLKKIKEEIKTWNHFVFGNIHQAQIQLNEKMKAIQQQIILSGRTPELSMEEGNTLSQQEERHKKEELLWKQKS